MDGEKGGGVLLVHLERLDEISIRLSRSPFVRTGKYSSIHRTAASA